MPAPAPPPLRLHYHPLSSFCHKVLIALYENATPFVPQLVDLGEPAARAAFLRLWPIGKFPLLEDRARDRLVPESSIIIDYLAQHYPGPTALLPAAPEPARETRLRDRFYDQYVQAPMQKIVGDRRRPAAQRDPFGVAEARLLLRTAYALIDRDMADRPWAMGEAFTLADCAAAPALFYAHKVEPLADHRQVAAYRDRLLARPSYARVIEEARPYFHLFPG